MSRLQVQLTDQNFPPEGGSYWSSKPLQIMLWLCQLWSYLKRPQIRRSVWKHWPLGTLRWIWDWMGQLRVCTEHWTQTYQLLFLRSTILFPEPVGFLQPDTETTQHGLFLFSQKSAKEGGVEDKNEHGEQQNKHPFSTFCLSFWPTWNKAKHILTT